MLMRVLLFVFASILVAAPVSTFEVKGLDPAIVSKLSAAESKLDAATEALTVAQKAVEVARRERDKVKSDALASIGTMAIEGQCASTKNYNADGTSFGSDYQKLYTRIELRGKYALITAGMESCTPSDWTTGTGSLIALPAQQGSNLILTQ